MGKWITWAGAVLALGGVSGCSGDPLTNVCKQLLSSQNEVADILAQVNDKDSAEMWKPKLEALAKKASEAKEAVQKFKDTEMRGVKHDQQKEVLAKILSQLEGDNVAGLARYQAERLRLSDPNAPPPTREAWVVVQKALANYKPEDMAKLLSGGMGAAPMMPPGMGGGGAPMGGGGAPMPGGGAPMPGGGAPMPGGGAPMPGGR